MNARWTWGIVALLGAVIIGGTAAMYYYDALVPRGYGRRSLSLSIVTAGNSENGTTIGVFVTNREGTTRVMGVKVWVSAAGAERPDPEIPRSSGLTNRHGFF
jgi:hypothetical protein